MEQLSVCLSIVCVWLPICVFISWHGQEPTQHFIFCLAWTLCGLVQHADKLATLERREADLKAQHNALANDAQHFKDKEGKFFSFVCFWGAAELHWWCRLSRQSAS